jgi:hypothetical protein
MDDTEYVDSQIDDLRTALQDTQEAFIRFVLMGKPVNITSYYDRQSRDYLHDLKGVVVDTFVGDVKVQCDDGIVRTVSLDKLNPVAP